MAGRTGRGTRQDVLEKLAQVGREHSDATVLFHATVANMLDLNLTDYKTLGILERLGPMSAGEIARQTGLATASVTNLIDRLEKKGFVRRVHDSKDRRRVVAEPMADRVTAARALFASTKQSLRRLFERYSDRELAVIADFMQRNTDRLRTETRKIDTSASGRELSK